MGIRMSRVKVTCQLVVDLGLVPLFLLSIKHAQVKVKISIPGVEGKPLFQSFASLFQLLPLQVTTSQLKQRDRHVLPGLTAVLIHLQSHAICLYCVLPLSELPASHAKIIQSLHVPWMKLHRFSVHFFGLDAVIDLRVANTKLEECWGIGVASLDCFVEKLNITMAGRLQLDRMFGEASGQFHPKFLRRLNAQRLSKRKNGVMPPSLLCK
mmetsp:Transcript_76798/g.126703  ORF Transcript_76798/g.126703 Transcript_76798/m.126703 type:complete len:210 (-) Transcript_76798:376-1005(-)